MALPARLNIHRGTWTSANATGDAATQYARGNMVVHDLITYLYIHTTPGDQDNPVTAGPSVWLPLGVDTHGATFITAASDAVVIDTGGVLSYDLDPATTGSNDFVNFIRIGPQISVAFTDRPTVASHTGWVYLQDQLTEAPFDGITIENNQISVDHSVVATHFNAQRTYTAGNSVFFDIGPTTSGRRIRSYWTTNAPITAGQVPVFTRDTVGAGTYEQNDYIVDTVGGNRGLYLRTSPTGTANRPSDAITGWTLQTPTAANWRELALDLNADSIGDLGDVDTTTDAPTNNQVLSWNGTNWVPADASAGTVNSVFGTTGNPGDGQILKASVANDVVTWAFAADNTSTGPGGAPVVTTFGASSYVENELVRQGTSLFVVRNTTQAAAASSPTNSDSGFLLVGEFDSTHTITYDGQTIDPSGTFTLREGDTLFLHPQLDFIGNVEVYQIRTNDLVLNDTTFGVSGGAMISNSEDDALIQFRGLLADRGVRTDNIGLLTANDFGAGFAETGAQIAVSLDQDTLDFVGGNIQVADGGIVNDKIADRTIEHLKLADNVISNRNIGDRAVHGDNIDQNTIERENLSLALQAQFDERGLVFHQTTGEVELGTIIRPTNLGSNNDWQMHILSDGQRTITFTEIDAPDISVGDHFSLRAGSVAPLTGTEQTNAVLRTPPITVPSVRTLTGNLASGPGVGQVTLSGIEIDGETPTADNTFTIGAGTVLRAGTHITIVNVQEVINSASVTLTATQHTDNAATLTNGTAITPLTETHDVTRIELSLVEGSTVGGMDVFDYLDALDASGTEGGDGVYTFSPQSSIYTRRSVVHTAHGDRVGNIANMPEVDFILNQDEFRVTSVWTGSANSRNSAGAYTRTTADDYENVFVSWSSIAANGEVYLVWRGDQTEIDAAIAALATVMNVSTNTDTGIYFNGNPAGIIIPNQAPNNIPYIRVIRNPTAYHADTANAIARGLRIRTSERGQRNAYRLRSGGAGVTNDVLEPTRVQSLFSNLTSTQNHSDEVSARVRFSGVDASGVAISSIPVTRFGTQIENGNAIAISTLFYSHNTNGAFPDPQTPDPGSRIRINETPYSVGTTISFNPVFAGSDDLIADIRGPSAQRVADDLDRTFTSSINSRIGALWFADTGVIGSELNTRVGIAYTDTQSGHHLQAYTERNWEPQHLIPGAVDRLSHVTFSANTRIGWRRDGDNFVVTVSGDDREHVGFAFRNFLENRVGRHSTLYFRSDSIGSPADDAAAALLPYIAIDLPNIEGYDGGSLARMTAIENQEPRFPAPDSQYDQAGATALSLFGLQEH